MISQSLMIIFSHSNCSEGLVDSGLESVVRGVGDVDSEQVFALLSHPPVVSKADTVGPDSLKSNL